MTGLLQPRWPRAAQSREKWGRDGRTQTSRRQKNDRGRKVKSFSTWNFIAPVAAIAIALRSIGFVAKLLYEAIEEIDSNQVEAITATGARPGQVIAYGIVPQILPAFAGIAVFRWDINIRESTVLGLVGAGGIGLQLQGSLNILAWPQVTLILIAILVAVLVSEWVSAKVRHAII